MINKDFILIIIRITTHVNLNVMLDIMKIHLYVYHVIKHAYYVQIIPVQVA